MKSFFSLFFCLMTFCVNAQRGELLLDVKGLPVKESKVYSGTYSTACCMIKIDGVEIIATNDSVFSNISGVVSFAGKIVDELAVIIKTDKSLIISFSKLNLLNVKKGDLIKKGDFVGTIKLDEENLFTLGFMVVNKNNNFYNESKTVAFLKQNTISTYLSNDTTIVAR